ncbi:Selenoprotein O [Merluccius polli]|uniref:Selenoprotein O n=1 Tax=Merluccius polli TaxID=89951 RepID=A0AA47MTA4_MERPO|nr:Selenoprotein O [Merluccius polli]
MAFLALRSVKSHILRPVAATLIAMDGIMGVATSRSPLDRLPFDNVVLRTLPLDSSEEPGPRTVRAACFSTVTPTPVTRPRFVAVSHRALSLLGLSGEEVAADPLGPEYLSGSRVMAGSRPAAHCYCGHQFGQFAGQLGDGAACYLGEVRAPAGQRAEPGHANPSGRQADGRKVLRSSIREFLCSEAIFSLGVPTTRAGSVVTSDSTVIRDINYDGNARHERCSVVLRIAPTFLRFGSFEIFKPADEHTGRQGPSYGHNEIRGQMLDYVIGTFYPEIQQNHSDRVERNVAFFREVMLRTARLVSQWQCIGFCHGVLNTDNMSILGLTLDYGPYGFMDRFDPDFICNASDNSGRYAYQAQPAICRWNLGKLAEALAPELPPDRAEAVLEEYMDLYNGFYLGTMRKKLGLLRKEEPEDEMLITALLQTMHNTGADFTNTFRSLAQIPCPTEGEEGVVKEATDLLLEQCTSLEELRLANKPSMEPRELAMLLSMAQSNPALFQMISDRKTIARQLEKLSKLQELTDTNQDELRGKQAEEWTGWITSYRKKEQFLWLWSQRNPQPHCAIINTGSVWPASWRAENNVQEVLDDRLRVMNSTNPRVVLRNYIAQNAIEAAENGDFSEPSLEQPAKEGQGTAGEAEEEPQGAASSTAASKGAVPYDSRPPAWASGICVS